MVKVKIKPKNKNKFNKKYLENERLLLSDREIEIRKKYFEEPIDMFDVNSNVSIVTRDNLE